MTQLIENEQEDIDGQSVVELFHCGIGLTYEFVFIHYSSF